MSVVVAADVIHVDVVADDLAGIPDLLDRRQPVGPLFDGAASRKMTRIRCGRCATWAENGFAAISLSISAGCRVITGTSSEKSAAIAVRTRPATCACVRSADSPMMFPLCR